MTEPQIEEIQMPDSYKVGDIVEFSPEWAPSYAGRAYRIVKVLQKNVDVEDEDGGKVRTDPWALLPSKRPYNRSQAPAVTAGSMVRVTCRLSGYAGDPKTGLFVALGGANKGKVKVAPLGGDRGRYWTVPPTYLVGVEPSDVLR